MLPSVPIRAVFLDAVGTLLLPSEPVALTYATIAARHGSRLTPEQIAPRFGAAFAREEERDRLAGWRADEPRELARWRSIVAEVLDDVPSPEPCFQELFSHFAHPFAWTTAEGAGEILSLLHRRGYALGICSNFDARLREVVAGLPELALARHLAISSEVGWRKPSPRFYHHLAEQVSLPPEQILIVGDDPVNDYQGATEAGHPALLLGPETRLPALPQIASLMDLQTLLP